MTKELTASTIVGRQIAAAREALRPRLSQAELLKRLNRTGVEMDQATLSRLESGKRRVTVEDLLAISAALGVAPLELLAGWLTNDPMPITPTQSRRGLDVRRWLRGEQALDEQTAETYFELVPDEERLARQWRGLLNLRAILSRDLTTALRDLLSGSPALQRHAPQAIRDAIADMRKELKWLQDEVAHEQERAERARKED
jgi:transcriptional regulator with XRE-family HTH domain